ncbi:MAG TPA: MgtC/SapB family protein [Stenomitos sp.]
MSDSDWSVVVRLVAAVGVGGLIGWNRQLNNKPAGLGTHMLVSLASALLVSIPEQLSPTPAIDGLSRVIQGVATGIGFIGAGEILRKDSPQTYEQSTIKGLTSAAAIWATAALGMLYGCGLWITAVTGSVLVMGILLFTKPLERSLSIAPKPKS